VIAVGLTGSIGMGKSNAAAVFRRAGVPVFDADAVVHDLYAGPLVPAIEVAFPGVVVDGAIDRGRLAAALAADASGFGRLEAIVHPAVRRAAVAFLDEHRSAGTPLVLVDVPLLYETGYDDLVDLVVVVSAPAGEQRRRVLGRPGMTEARFAELLARQLPDAEKRARADVVVDTSGSHAETEAVLGRLIDRLQRGKSLGHDHPAG
jgi:dephospho-CoA kinase